MTFTLDKNESLELRKKFSIDLCDNFIKRLKPYQSKETKLNAIIAIRNLIKESKISDPILYSCLVDSIADTDEDVIKLVIRVIQEVINDDVIELLNIKLNELLDTKAKKEIVKILNSVQTQKTN